MELDALREQIERLNKELLPIANKPIAFGSDFSSYQMPHNAAANEALLDAIELYSRSDAASAREFATSSKKTTHSHGRPHSRFPPTMQNGSESISSISRSSIKAGTGATL